MRKLIIDGQQADIAPDTVIEFTLRSSILVFDKPMGSYSTEFELPYRHSPRNQVIFQFSGKPSRKKREKLELPASFYWKGSLVCQGIVSATNYGDTVTCYLLIENGAFNDETKELYVNELDWGSGSEDWTVKKRYYPEYKWCLPYYWDGTYYNSFVENGAYKLGREYSEGFWDRLFMVAPSLYIEFVIKQLMELLGKRWGRFELDERKMILLGLFDLTKNLGVFPYTDYGLPDTFEVSKLLPKKSVKEFLIGIENLFNVKFLFKGDRVDLISREELVKAKASKGFVVGNVELTPREGEAFKYVYDVATNSENWWETWSDLSEDDREVVLLDWNPQGGEQRNEVLDDKLYLSLNKKSYWKKKLVDETTVSYEIVSMSCLQPFGHGESNIPGTVLGYQLPTWGFYGEFSEDKVFEDFRVQYVEDDSAHNQKQVDSDGGYLVARDFVGGDPCLFDKYWTKTFDWLNNYAEEVSGTVEAKSREHFILELDFTAKYRDQHSQNYILEEVVVGFGEKRITGLEWKGRTCL